jgi:hypothetical protein
MDLILTLDYYVTMDFMMKRARDFVAKNHILAAITVYMQIIACDMHPVERFMVYNSMVCCMISIGMLSQALDNIRTMTTLPGMQARGIEYVTMACLTLYKRLLDRLMMQERYLDVFQVIRECLDEQASDPISVQISHIYDTVATKVYKLRMYDKVVCKQIVAHAAAMRAAIEKNNRA